MPTLFNGCGFGPPPPFTAASSWTWVDHPVSGLRRLTVALLRLAFASAPYLWHLTLPGPATRRTVLQKVRGRTSRASTACKHRVSGSLSLPSRGPFHLSFTVLCSIGHQRVFSLAGWSPLLPTGFLVSRGTLDPAASAQVSSTGLSPSPAGLPSSIPLLLQLTFAVLNPGVLALRFGLFRVRSPLLPESIFLSFPPAT